MIRIDSVDMLPALAPTPPEVEPCSCDEALALRRELGAARARLARAALPDARQLAILNTWRDGGPGHD